MFKKFLRRLAILMFILIALCMAFLAIGAFSKLDNFVIQNVEANAANGARTSRNTTIIDNVNVVDVKTGVVQTTQSVVILANKIAFIGAYEQVPSQFIDTPTHRIDGANGYLIPGMWDSHLHTLSIAPQVHFPLLLANGVTTVRDMGEGCSWRDDLSCVPDIASWRQQQRDGKLLMPRIIASASYHIESTDAVANSNEAAARETYRVLIKALKQRGDDFIKPQLSYDANPRLFEILLAEAAQANMPVAGHMPYQYDLARPSSAPLISVEHDAGLLPQCSTARAQYDGRNRAKAALLAAMNAQRCDAVLQAMAAQRIAFVPTHIAASAQDYFLLDNETTNMPNLKYVVAPMRWMWRAYGAANKAGANESDKDTLHKLYRASLDLTKRAHTAGVPVLAGTDAMDANIVHGFSLHDELQQFIEAGLTPLDALRAATIVPATHFGRADDLGSIEVGKIADLVLLNANPLVDIQNTKNIRAVWLNGQHLNRDTLSEMLQWTADNANSTKLNTVFVWRMIYRG
jgi:imidazolonepropionase-like amidohydrolase